MLNIQKAFRADRKRENFARTRTNLFLKHDTPTSACYCFFYAITFNCDVR